MRGLVGLVAILILLSSSGCALGPTGQEIAESLQRTLRSVAGNWHATSFGADPITLEFHLKEDRNGAVTGTGTMKESGVGPRVAVTLFGTYRRPVLALTFTGLRDGGERVQGVLEGEYTTVGGISTTLRLTGAGSSRAVPILLQEE